MLSRASENKECLLNSELNGELVVNLPLGERAFIRGIHMRERKVGGYFVSATTPMCEIGGNDFYAVTRISENLLRVELNLFDEPYVVIER